jgi:hypothetical protein
LLKIAQDCSRLLKEDQLGADEAMTLYSLADSIIGSPFLALVRPVPLTAARAKCLTSPVVTMKLDGTRVALILNSTEVLEVRAARVTVALDRFKGKSTSDPVTVLDCEECAGSYFLLDALVVGGVDVRSMPLESRLEAGRIEAPDGISIKPYLGVGIKGSQATLKNAVKLLHEKGGSDGLIFLNASDPYWIPPLKYKPVITTDFLIESSVWVQDEYILFTTNWGRPLPWREANGNVCSITLPLVVARHLISKNISRRDAVIVECTRSDAGVFKARSLRRDRLRPNRREVVYENVQLQKEGCNQTSWLFAVIPKRDPVECFWRFVVVCYRALVIQAGVQGMHVFEMREGASRCSPVGLGLHIFKEQGAYASVTGVPYTHLQGSYFSSGKLTEGEILFLFLNVEKMGSIEAVARLCIKLGVSKVAGIVLQPRGGSSRGLYRCTPGPLETYSLQIGSPEVEVTTRIDISMPPLGFSSLQVRLPNATDAMGVGSEAAGLLSGLGAFLWERQ